MYILGGVKCWNSRAVADKLGMGRNTLLKELRARGVLDSKNLPKTSFVREHPGYLRVESRVRNGFIMSVTYYSSEAIEHFKSLLDITNKPRNYKQEKLTKDLEHIFAPLEL